MCGVCVLEDVNTMETLHYTPPNMASEKNQKQRTSGKKTSGPPLQFFIKNYMKKEKKTT
jgi:hypothetical protein